MFTIILQGANLNQQKAEAAAIELRGELESRADHYRVHTNETLSPNNLQTLREGFDFDINPLPTQFDASAVKLLVMDMDSTLINIECIDEIADFINIKPKVSEITEAAMRGEIDFTTSLRQRVKLLKGLDATALEHVYNERLGLNPGAELMLEGLRNRDIKAALVSGGFTFFTDKLKERLALDYSHSNQLEVIDNKLTGHVVGDNIVGAEAKAEFLLQRCEELGIQPNQTVAMGDGANDLNMMSVAGLSIAFRAKPKVQAQADAALNYCGLDGALTLIET